MEYPENPKDLTEDQRVEILLGSFYDENGKLMIKKRLFKKLKKRLDNYNNYK